MICIVAWTDPARLAVNDEILLQCRVSYSFICDMHGSIIDGFHATCIVNRVRCVGAAGLIVRAEVHDSKLTRYGHM